MRNILWTRDDSDAWTTECHQGPRGSIEAHLAKCFALARLGGQRYDLGGYHSSLTSAHRAREVHQASRQHLHSRLDVVSRGILSILDNYYWLVNTEPRDGGKHSLSFWTSHYVAQQPSCSIPSHLCHLLFVYRLWSFSEKSNFHKWGF